MKLVVLSGGDSPEREVSLRSGRAVAAALDKKGHRVTVLDPAEKNFPAALLSSGPACVFIALHGGNGENGGIQGFLETLGLPYTGAGVLSSSICMNKIVSKKIMAFHGIPTPGFLVLEKPAVPAKIPFPFPVVVKAANLGSTVGISIVRKRADLAAAVRASFKYDREVFIEEYIAGTEITVSVLGNDRPKVLPIIEIETPTGFYDYRAKYTAGGSVHRIPPRMPEKTLRRAGEIALLTYRALHCAGLSRTEMMVSAEGVPYVLDINTIPGFTETSLFPDAARSAGIPFEELCETLVTLGLEKWKKKPKNG